MPRVQVVPVDVGLSGYAQDRARLARVQALIDDHQWDAAHAEANAINGRKEMLDTFAEIERHKQSWSAAYGLPDKT